MKVLAIVGLFILALFCISCHEEKKELVALPSGFPLAPGNGWVYEVTEFKTDGSVDTSYNDSIAVTGMANTYYKYKDFQNDDVLLVNNQDNKFMLFGTENVMFPDPSIILVYNETGFYTSPFWGTVASHIDSIKISTIQIPFKDKIYNSYNEKKYYRMGFINSVFMVETTYNKLGYYSIIAYNSENEIVSQTILKKRIDVSVE